MIIFRLSSCLFVVFVRLRAFLFDGSVAFADEDKTRYSTRNFIETVEGVGLEVASLKSHLKKKVKILVRARK